MENEADRRKFGHWLANRIVEAKLTVGEKNVFSNWLKTSTEKISARGAKTDAGSSDPAARVTLQELRQFMVWLKERMKETPLAESEKRELKDWLLTCVSAQRNLDETELEQVKNEIR